MGWGVGVSESPQLIGKIYLGQYVFLTSWKAETLNDAIEEGNQTSNFVPLL